MAVVIPEAILSNGWVFREKCRCGGILQYKFRHPDKPGLELKWLVGYHQFKVMDKNRTKVPVTKISMADEILKNL